MIFDSITSQAHVGTEEQLMKEKGFTSKVVHIDRRSNLEAGAVHQPCHQSVLYEYPKVEELIDVFQGKSTKHAYARSSTPSTSALQNIICQLDKAIATCVFSTGMAAISTTILSLLKARDHIIVSHYLFGNSNSFFQQLKNYGIEVSFVDLTSSDEAKSAIKSNTRLIFTETIANPATQVADIEGLATLAAQFNLLLVIDTTLTPCYLFDAKKAGADLILGSLTKYFGGHANALGGWVSDTGKFNWAQFPNINPSYRHIEDKLQGMAQIRKKGLRDMGASISSEACHMLSVGVETLALRLDKICANALLLAMFFQNHNKIKKVYYPGLPQHPQHQRAAKLFKYFGGLLSIDLVDGCDYIKFINKLELAISSTHLGDNRTLIIPAAPTIYHEMGFDKRQEMGISENLIRISVGIEDSEDLIADFTQALKQV